MALVVVDASAVAALIFGEPEAEVVSARLEGFDLAAPALLPFEVANVAVVKVRRRSIPARAAAAALELFGRLPLDLYEADATSIAKIAEGTGLTAYDAAYLLLAGSLGVELVTLDRRLARAAGRGPAR